MTELYIATGPESSGKTTLCTQLARTLQVPMVSEAARGYLEARMRLHPGYQYTSTDLLSIAQIQHAAETLSYNSERLPLICDTDLLVLMVWSEEKFGQVTPWITHNFLNIIARHNRHYFLCHWDIPWQHDPLRENPEDRQRLFERYLQKLDEYLLPYTILEGSAETRLHLAQEVISTSRARAARSEFIS